MEVLDRNGSVLLRLSGDEVKNWKGQVLARIEGEGLRNAQGQELAAHRDGRVVLTGGAAVGVDGDRILGSDGSTLATLAAAGEAPPHERDLLAAAFLLFFT